MLIISLRAGDSCEVRNQVAVGCENDFHSDVKTLSTWQQLSRFCCRAASICDSDLRPKRIGKEEHKSGESRHKVGACRTSAASKGKEPLVLKMQFLDNTRFIPL